MSKFKLIVDFDSTNLEHSIDNSLVTVKVPFLSNKKLMYGIGNAVDKLNQESIYPTEIGFDIMTLATMVYLADTRISRAVHGQDSWTREIQLQIPVSDTILWNGQICLINRMLKFLTGDLWDISFTERTWTFNHEDQSSEKTTSFNKATLFSGGMDSLISTINLMENKENALLIGHAGEGLIKNAQTNILKKFDESYPEIKHSLMDLWMVFPDNYIPTGENDNNTRSRSFLFIGFGLFAISGTANIKELMVPENGLIALNVPLDETRNGSFSTRTTHPFYLNSWNELLSRLGLDLFVNNPYWNKTKGEMADECLNKTFLLETMKLSFSCSSPGKARWRGLSPQHCGYCVPCIIRRAAMHKAFTNDVTVYTENSINNMLANSSTGIGIQLRSFQYAINRIKKQPGIERFLIHKTGPLQDNIKYKDELADTYRRGILEVDDFIQFLVEKETNV